MPFWLKMPVCHAETREFILRSGFKEIKCFIMKKINIVGSFRD